MNSIRIRKAIAVLLSLFCLIAALSGCSGEPGERETSASALLSSVEKNLSDAKSFSGSISTELNLKKDGEALNAKLSYAMEYVASPTALHLSGEIASNYQGEDSSVEIETYSVPDEEKGNLIYSRMNQSWSKEALEEPQTNAAENDLFATLSSMSDEDLKLEEQWGTFNNQQVYVVTATLTGDALLPYLELLQNTSQETAGTKPQPSSEQLSAEVTAYVYPSKYPAQLTITFHDQQNQIPALIGYEDADLEALQMVYGYEKFNHLSSIEVPEDVVSAAKLNEIYQSVVDEETKKPLETDENGNYVLGDFYNNQYTVAITPRKNLKIDEANSGSGWLYFTYKTDQGEISGTYYLMPMTDQYGVEDLKKELDEYYNAFEQDETSEVTRIDSLISYEVDGREAIMDRLDFTYPEQGYHGSMRNYCMVVDAAEELVVQCVLTETLYTPEAESLFTDDELAEELLSNIIYE